MDDQLQQLIELQKEQNQLLRRYLWRFRFSLMALLLLTTTLCVGLGFLVYQTRPKAGGPPVTVTTAPPNTYRLWQGSTGTLSIDSVQLSDELKLFEQPVDNSQ
jgi:hypothetical protein